MRTEPQACSAVPKVELNIPKGIQSLDGAALRKLLFSVEVAEKSLSALKVQITQRSAELHRLGSSERPEDLLARSGETPRREISKTVKTATVVSAAPELAEKLPEIPKANLNTVVTAISKLDEGEVASLDMSFVAEAAAEVEVNRFGSKLNQHITERAVTVEDQYMRARKASEVKHWFDSDQQMGFVHAKLDPIRYEAVAKKLDKAVSSLANTKSTSRDDRSSSVIRRESVRKDANLAAEAFYQLLTNTNVTSQQTANTSKRISLKPQAEVLVVVDAQTLKSGFHSQTVCETENGTAVSEVTFQRQLCNSVYRKVVTDKSSVPIDVGRRYRTATDAQWSAIKSIHSTCAWKDCEVRIGWCQPHHIQYWEHNGKTDIVNLVPLCNEHHHLVHEGSWSIKLEPDRRLKIFDPGNQLIATTDPPNRNRNGGIDTG